MMAVGIYTIAFFISFFFHKIGLYYYSGWIMIINAIFLYFLDVKEKYEFTNLRALFALGYVGGLGVSLFKLSKLSIPYESLTWVCFFIVYPLFYLGYWLIDRAYKKKDIDKVVNYDIKASISNIERHERDVDSSFCAAVVLILVGITFISFSIEAIILKFIPLFTHNTPHAYSTFHVFGLHYITVLYVFIPPIGIIYWWKRRKIDLIFGISIIYPLLIALLLISRSGLLFTFFLSFGVFLILQQKDALYIYKMKNKEKRVLYISFILISFALLIALYIVITMFRAHSKEYLLEIFEMKDENIPIYIAQPYTYIANNYENFNYLVKNISKHTYGLKSLYPLFTFSGIKFLFPQLVQIPLLYNKEELTTTTIMYDAFYDFGVVGVATLSLILGVISAYLVNIVKRSTNIMIYLLNSQFMYYLFFSFFSCWFSLPQTYVYIIVNLILIFMYKKFFYRYCHL